MSGSLHEETTVKMDVPYKGFNFWIHVFIDIMYIINEKRKKYINTL